MVSNLHQRNSVTAKCITNRWIISNPYIEEHMDHIPIQNSLTHSNCKINHKHESCRNDTTMSL